MKIFITEKLSRELSGDELSDRLAMNLPYYAAGVLPICKNTGRILLAKRGPKITEPNKWANWGGGHGWYEDAKTTATREFFEESGVIVPIELIDSYVDEHKDGFKYYNFIGLVEYEFKPKTNVITVDGDIEVSDFKWVTLEQFLRMDSKKIHWGVTQLFKKCLGQIKAIIDKCDKNESLFLKESVDDLSSEAKHLHVALNTLLAPCGYKIGQPTATSGIITFECEKTDKFRFENNDEIKKTLDMLQQEFPDVTIEDTSKGSDLGTLAVHLISNSRVII